MSVLDSLKDSTAAWLVLAAIAVFSLVFAVYTWFAGKRKREFSYCKSSFQIVNASISTVNDLTLLYNGAEIPDISVTKFVIWNSGHEEIQRSDLYDHTSLCITAEDGTSILDASIIPESDPGGKFSIPTGKANQDTHEIAIDFECAEKKEGFAIQVLHSGSADGLIPSVSIKGGKPMRVSPGIISVFHVFFYFFLILISLIPSPNLPVFLITIIILCVGIFFFFKYYRIIGMFSIPANLRKYIKSF